MRFLVSCLLAAISAASCTGAHDRSPVTTRPDHATGGADQVARTINPAPPPKPLHKGGVDLSNGVYIREDDDLIVNTPFPIVLRRTYNSYDHYSRQFGVNGTHTGEVWIYGDADPRIPWGDLILATGTRIHFARISPGVGRDSAVLRHDNTPTEFNGAMLRWNGSAWEMTLRDGSVNLFKDCEAKGEDCWLIERRDPAGHRIAYVRDASERLLRMESEGQSIAFEYDDRKRIVRAYDTSHREVSYAYDSKGRLVRAQGNDGVVREYEYDERDNLIGVREPGRIVRNWYDAAGRWTRQTVKDSDQDPDPYIATARYVVENGSVVEAAWDEGDGVEVRRYDGLHYMVSATLHADGATPIVFRYSHDSASHIVTSVTMECQGAAGAVSRSVEPASARSASGRLTLIRESCRSIW